MSSVRDMYRMFYRAKKFNQDLTGWQVGQIPYSSDCTKFCRLSGLSNNNAPSLPKRCLKRC